MKEKIKEYTMSKRMFIGMLVCSAMILGVVQAYADGLGPGRWWRLPELSRDMGLTDREKQMLDDMFVKNRNALIDLRSDIEKEQLKLEDLLAKDTFNETAAKAQFKRVEDKRVKIAFERFQFILDARKLLGPERFRILTAKFEEMKKDRRDRAGRDRRYHDWRQ
jgi:Spy/CpxP family protein refolding chaperone